MFYNLMKLKLWSACLNTRRQDGEVDDTANAFLLLQVIIGIGAKPAVGPFEMLGLNTNVGGIQVRLIGN